MAEAAQQSLLLLPLPTEDGARSEEEAEEEEEEGRGRSRVRLCMPADRGEWEQEMVVVVVLRRLLLLLRSRILANKSHRSGGEREGDRMEKDSWDSSLPSPSSFVRVRPGLSIPLPLNPCVPRLILEEERRSGGSLSSLLMQFARPPEPTLPLSPSPSFFLQEEGSGLLFDLCFFLPHPSLLRDEAKALLLKNSLLVAFFFGLLSFPCLARFWLWLQIPTWDRGSGASSASSAQHKVFPGVAVFLGFREDFRTSREITLYQTLSLGWGGINLLLIRKRGTSTDFGMQRGRGMGGESGEGSPP